MSYIPIDSTCPVCRAYPGERCPHRGKGFKIVQNNGWTYEYEYEYYYHGSDIPAGAHMVSLRAWDSQGRRAYWRDGGWVIED